MLRLNKSLWTVFVPLVFSFLSIVMQSFVVFILSILLHFVVLCLVADFRRNENAWMFIMVALSTIPINFFLLLVFSNCEMLFYSVGFVNILKGILYYIALFCIEEAAMGTITRLIWKKQYDYLKMECYDEY